MAPSQSSAPHASEPSTTTLHVGVIGGGLGGLTASIALRRAGARVTVLEAATALGEIGAGIQMSGNISRFLIRTGVDKIIGSDLVACNEVRNWAVDVDYDDEEEENQKDPIGTGRLISKSLGRDVARDMGFPWWVVRRDHLHAGLAESSRQHGADIIIDSRVTGLDADENGVRVTTQNGKEYKFDLVVGADGINSAVRKIIFPNLKPQAASRIAAYRAVLPYETVYEKIPEAKTILSGCNMDAWAGPGGYVLLYPLSGGRELNVVTANMQDHDVVALEEVEVEEFRKQYSVFPKFVRKILGLVKETKRWPLLTVPPVKTWSNEHKNIVLMGDAIHGMQNHMAQGAATSMEDGIFLGRIVSEVLRNTIDLTTGIHLYEKKRIPRALHKQQSALCQGEMWSISDLATRRARHDSESAQVASFMRNPANPSEQLPPTFRSTMLFMNPNTVPGILYYDAEGDADFAVDEWLMQQTGVDDQKRLVSSKLSNKWWSAVWENGVQRWESGEGVKKREKSIGKAKL